MAHFPTDLVSSRASYNCRLRRDRTLSAPATTKAPQIAPAVGQNRDLRVRAVRSGASPF
ncbi:hypothetical protein QUB77_14905 [Microcoleus sp. AT9b-C3]